MADTPVNEVTSTSIASAASTTASTPPPTAPPSPRWYRRHARRIAAALAAAAGLLVLAQLLLLPWLLKNRIVSALDEAGVKDVQFRVARATLWGSQLTNITAGDRAILTIGRIDLDYALSDLWNGQLRNLRISDAMLKLNAGDGGVDLKPLQALYHPLASSRKEPSQPLRLPARRIELAASKILVQTPRDTHEIPVGGSIAQQSDGRVSISLQIDQDRAIDIGATLDGSKLTFAGAADPGRTLLIVRSIWPDAAVGVDGRLKLSGEASWAPATTRPAGRAELAIVPQTASATTEPAVSNDKLHLASGVFHMTAAFGGDGPAVSLAMKDVTLAMKDQGFSADGVRGEVNLLRFSPLTTPPAQKVAAAKLSIGQMSMTDGTIQFSMTASDAVHVKHTEWTWLGGRVWADDFDIRADQPIRVTLHAQDVEMKDLLANFAQDKASGEGKISGDIPLVIDGSNVQFGNGRVTGIRGGKVQIKDMASILPTAEAAAKAASGISSDQVKKNVIEALSDFQYDTLTAELSKEPQGLVGHVHMRGHGRTGQKQPLNYELNVNGIDKGLRTYLRLREGLMTPRRATTRTSAPAAATTTGKAELP